MPEYPDLTVYIERLKAMLGGRVLEGIRVASPFVLRTVDPPLDGLEMKRYAKTTKANPLPLKRRSAFFIV